MSEFSGSPPQHHQRLETVPSDCYVDMNPMQSVTAAESPDPPPSYESLQQDTEVRLYASKQPRPPRPPPMRRNVPETQLNPTTQQQAPHTEQQQQRGGRMLQYEGPSQGIAGNYNQGYVMEESYLDPTHASTQQSHDSTPVPRAQPRPAVELPVPRAQPHPAADTSKPSQQLNQQPLHDETPGRPPKIPPTSNLSRPPKISPTSNPNIPTKIPPTSANTQQSSQSFTVSQPPAVARHQPPAVTCHQPPVSAHRQPPLPLGTQSQAVQAAHSQQLSAIPLQPVRVAPAIPVSQLVPPPSAHHQLDHSIGRTANHSHAMSDTNPPRDCLPWSLVSCVIFCFILGIPALILSVCIAKDGRAGRTFEAQQKWKAMITLNSIATCVFVCVLVTLLCVFLLLN